MRDWYDDYDPDHYCQYCNRSPCEIGAAGDARAHDSLYADYPDETWEEYDARKAWRGVEAWVKRSKAATQKPEPKVVKAEVVKPNRGQDTTARLREFMSSLPPEQRERLERYDDGCFEGTDQMFASALEQARRLGLLK